MVVLARVVSRGHSSKLASDFGCLEVRASDFTSYSYVPWLIVSCHSVMVALVESHLKQREPPTYFLASGLAK